MILFQTLTHLYCKGYHATNLFKAVGLDPEEQEGEEKLERQFLKGLETRISLFMQLPMLEVRVQRTDSKAIFQNLSKKLTTWKAPKAPPPLRTKAVRPKACRVSLRKVSLSSRLRSGPLCRHPGLNTQTMPSSK